MRVRHEGISFNFEGVGEWYEPESDEEAKRLVERYPDIEVQVTVQPVSNGVPIGKTMDVTTKCAPMPMIDPESTLDELIDYVGTANEDDPAPIPPPIHTTGPWWEYNGKKYRGKKSLPPEALAMIKE